jgi:hypothetical protein
LEQLTTKDLAVCDAGLRSAASGTDSRAEAAKQIVQYLYDAFREPGTNKPASVLLRCFQTCAYARLPVDYQYAADRLLEMMPVESTSHDQMRCLTLLATHGERLVWNHPATSVGHQAIPLPSVEVVEQAPMISRLLSQFGVPIQRIVTGGGEERTLLLDDLPQDFNVFHIPEALGSPFIPAQANFVEPFAVRSAVGMGGRLADGEIFAVVLFARVAVSREVSAMFKTLAASTREVLDRFSGKNLFTGSTV